MLKMKRSAVLSPATREIFYLNIHSLCDTKCFMSTPPNLQNTAFDHLRVIRTLMERASIYRAVSAPAALIGGTLALGVALYGCMAQPATGNLAFLGAWIAALSLTTFVNLFLLTREVGSRGQPLVTDGLRMALRAIVPPMLTGGILGACLILDSQRTTGALVWILCYGLALQATVGFAPPSIIRLARAFLIAGQVIAIGYFAVGRCECRIDDQTLASLLLGLTFGVFHLVYGGAVFFNKSKTASPATRDEGILE